MATIHELKQAIANDDALRAKLEKARSVAEFLRIAAEHGVPVTQDDLARELAAEDRVSEDRELNDSELDKVAGGIGFGHNLSSFSALGSFKGGANIGRSPSGIVIPNC